jgi:hypothetical protein
MKNRFPQSAMMRVALGLLVLLASAAYAAEAPYSGTAAAVPGTVQAENYDTGGQAVAYNVTSTNGSDNGYRSDGTDLEVTTDTGGGVDLGWTTSGQWFRYTVNVATAGKYTVTFRVASPTAVADALHISNSAGTNLSGSVAVPATGGYQTWTSVTASVTLPAGTQTLTVNQDAGGWNLNWFSFAAVTSGEGPYGGTAAAIPGTVMAENYDTGGQGVAYNVTSTNGSANSYRSDGIDLEAATSPATGNDLGWTAAGQWFRYTVNVSTAGTYTVSILVASPTAVADGFHISNSSGTNLSGSVAVPATGGYQTWATVTASVTLPAGTQTLTVNQDAGGWNIDSLKFASSGGGGLTSAKITAGTYTFIPQNATGLRLDDEAASTATGNPIDVYTANSTAAQNWALTSSGVTPSGYYNLSTEGAYCLTASGAASGSAVVLDPCAGSSGQAWAAVASGSNYTFHPANNTGLCLDVTSAGTASGTLVQVYTCNATSAQSWALSTAGSGSGGGAPSKLFAPYLYLGDYNDANAVASIQSASGVKGVTMAFLDPYNNGCSLIWPGANGPLPSDTIGSTSVGAQIAALQAKGVTVVISQGGAGGQEGAAYCSSASATQALYQSIINQYHVNWLDFDIEYSETSGQSARRAQALAALQAANPGLTISYTLGVGPGGLDSGSNGGTSDIADAKTYGLNLNVVNIMAMDYGGSGIEMGSTATEAAGATLSQIQSAGLSSKVGITPMIGQNDSGGEVFQLSDATTVVNFANSNSYVAFLGFWSMARDNGGCAGDTTASGSCSGVSQSNYQFSSIFNAY